VFCIFGFLGNTYYQQPLNDIDAVLNGSLSNNYLLTSAIANSTLFSLSLWIRPDIGVSSIPSPPLVASIVSINETVVLLWFAGQNSIQLQIGSFVLQANNVNINNGQWTHVTVCVDYFSLFSRLYLT
jgi:hypothetical protein